MIRRRTKPITRKNCATKAYDMPAQAYPSPIFAGEAQKFLKRELFILILGRFGSTTRSFDVPQPVDLPNNSKSTFNIDSPRLQIQDKPSKGKLRCLSILAASISVVAHQGTLDVFQKHRVFIAKDDCKLTFLFRLSSAAWF